MHRKSIIQDIFHHIGTAKIACGAGINKNIHNVAGFYQGLTRVIGNDLFNYGHKNRFCQLR